MVRCTALGAIAERNGVYIHGLAKMIAATGKPVSELTIGELLMMDVRRSREYDAIPRPERRKAVA